MLLPVYLRKEPTTDPVLRDAVAKGFAHVGALTRRWDVVAYRDATATEPVGRWGWWVKRRPRANCPRITLNCYPWRAVWLTAVAPFA